MITALFYHSILFKKKHDCSYLSLFFTVPYLNPDLGNRIPQITANGSTLALLTPAEFENRPGQSSSFRIGDSNLEWQTSYGSLPAGAFGIQNNYAGRYDYVCKYSCSSGFFNPSKGPYCHYPLSGKENLGHPFEILVNKDNFEVLEWRDDSWGDVPPNSVYTCSGLDLYVGRNKYGLGKVQVGNGAFFLPWEGDEYWYKYYQVLTIRKDITSEHMSDVSYITDNVEVFELPPETLYRATITNNECSSVVKTVELSESCQEEKRWDISRATTSGVRVTLSAEIPSFGSAGIEFGTETTEQYSVGVIAVESKTFTVSVEQTVPPNHSCGVSMVGHKYTANIPYTARLRRTYGNGQTRLANIDGVFYGVNIGAVQAVVDRCEPLPNAKPCP